MAAPQIHASIVGEIGQIFTAHPGELPQVRISDPTEWYARRSEIADELTLKVRMGQPIRGRDASLVVKANPDRQMLEVLCWAVGNTSRSEMRALAMNPALEAMYRELRSSK